MGRLGFVVVLILIVFLIDLYLFRSFRVFFQDAPLLAKRLFALTWWGIPVVLLITYLFFKQMPRWVQLYSQNLLMILIFSKLLAAVFMLMGEAGWGIYRLYTGETSSEEAWLSRRRFIAKLGVITSGIPLLTMGYGMLRTATNFRVHKVKLTFPNLPESFHGFKIVQISDIHTGSWIRIDAMKQVVERIHFLNPDVIVFTGDLVNNRTDEAYPFRHVLKKLHAPFGVFSILGNHDYGDYERWPNVDAKKQNLEAMYQLHKDLGWKLMLNSHTLIEKDAQKIALIGIENWGAALHFPKYGKLKDAHQGTEMIPFKILLSHDPSHWDAEVRKDYPDIDLTLSGHTHGFQFGIEIPGFKWSPSQWIYKQWAGLYQNGNQYIYVNRGTGCIGYSGRVGIPPEITLIELQKKD